MEIKSKKKKKVISIYGYHLVFRFLSWKQRHIDTLYNTQNYFNGWMEEKLITVLSHNPKKEKNEKKLAFCTLPKIQRR